MESVRFKKFISQSEGDARFFLKEVKRAAEFMEQALDSRDEENYMLALRSLDTNVQNVRMVLDNYKYDTRIGGGE